MHLLHPFFYFAPRKPLNALRGDFRAVILSINKSISLRRPSSFIADKALLGSNHRASLSWASGQASSCR